MHRDGHESTRAQFFGFAQMSRVFFWLATPFAVLYCLGVAKQKSYQKLIIFDFDTTYFHPNPISSKYGDHHSIPREILRRSLMLIFHLKLIIKQISLIEQKFNKP